MKRFTKLILMLTAIMTIVFSSAAIANATTLYPKQIGCTDTTITIDPGNFSTDVTYYEIYIQPMKDILHRIYPLQQSQLQ